jgi:hypothetical protein
MRGRRRRRRRRRGRRRNSNRFRVLSFPSQKNITILQILFKLPSMRPTVAFLIYEEEIFYGKQVKSGKSTQMDTKSQSDCWDRSPLDKNVSDYRFRVVAV